MCQCEHNYGNVNIHSKLEREVYKQNAFDNKSINQNILDLPILPPNNKQYSLLSIYQGTAFPLEKEYLENI